MTEPAYLAGRQQCRRHGEAPAFAGSKSDFSMTAIKGCMALASVTAIVANASGRPCVARPAHTAPCVDRADLHQQKQHTRANVARGVHHAQRHQPAKTKNARATNRQHGRDHCGEDGDHKVMHKPLMKFLL